MMVHIHNSSGKELFSITAKTEAQVEANVPTGGGWVEVPPDDSIPLGEGYVSEGLRLARPEISIPATHQLAVNTDWTIPGVPEGTLVIINGEESGEVDASGLVLEFSDTGVWKLELRPPFPWRDAICEVTVT